ncbi:Orotate phosphoribosyltransferase [Frankliniella fusca]|uniref:Orotate phosphoribosyltransferase n=1 Tax=Frankliniella fusca TaxID=407009 RepID=A0AAE1HXD5_9NEOP|nr:Orotate phosphoribosyltransferase [Frankliniella fusca]
MKYPHLQSYQILSYEYGLLQKLNNVKMHENMESTMSKLKEHYHLTEDDILTEIHILENVFNDVTPIQYRKIGMTVPLDVKDEEVVRNQEQTETHSPRIQVLTRFCPNNGKDIPIMSFLLGCGKVLNKCENPGGLEIAVQLLSAYFIMDLKYPNSFKSFLRFLEKTVNGGLCLQTLKQKPHAAYNKFVLEAKLSK